MKFVILAAALLAVAQGGIQLSSDEDPAWMLIPDANGKPQIVILRGPMPEDPYAIDLYTDVQFFLYTRANPTVAVQMWVDNMNNAPYDPSKPVKMIMHGYNTNIQTQWIIDMKDAYLRAQDVNVILVDWGKLSDGLLYNVVQTRTKTVGEYMAVFLNFLVANGGSLNMFHCVGHSLGAHGCGCAGKSLGGGMQRITGMDAALPLYYSNNTDETLAQTDAMYVDAIHTCGGWLGFMDPLGHADYYPNNGQSSQPGCGIDLLGDCSHSRSHEFFQESIESNGFVAHLCDSWDLYNGGSCSTTPTSLMGEPSDPSSRGLYYLHTRKDPPFAMG